MPHFTINGDKLFDLFCKDILIKSFNTKLIPFFFCLLGIDIKMKWPCLKVATFCNIMLFAKMSLVVVIVYHLIRMAERTCSFFRLEFRLSIEKFFVMKAIYMVAQISRLSLEVTVSKWAISRFFLFLSLRNLILPMFYVYMGN